LSCASSTFCFALIAQKAFVYDGRTWLATADTITTPLPIMAISCSSRSFCLAGDDGGNIYSYAGAAWSKIDQVTGDAISSISCPSSAFCAVATHLGDVVTYSHGAWSRAQSLGGSVGLAYVSCDSTSSCTAVRGESAFSYVDGEWSGGQIVTTGSNVTSNLSGVQPSLGGVTCPSSTSCMAGDDLGNVFTQSAGRWSSGQLITGPTDVVALSCGSPRFCVAFGGHPATAFVYSETRR
jgi:hypothetical protein